MKMPNSPGSAPPPPQPPTMGLNIDRCINQSNCYLPVCLLLWFCTHILNHFTVKEESQQAQKGDREHVIINVSSVSHWLTKWPDFCQPITELRSAKPKQTALDCELLYATLLFPLTDVNCILIGSSLCSSPCKAWICCLSSTPPVAINSWNDIVPLEWKITKMEQSYSNLPCHSALLWKNCMIWYITALFFREFDIHQKSPQTQLFTTPISQKIFPLVLSLDKKLYSPPRCTKQALAISPWG